MGWSIAATDGVPSRDPDVGNLGDRMAMWNYDCRHFAFGINLRCAVGADWNTAPARGLLWGDSQSRHLLPYLDEAGKKTNRSLALFYGCSPPLGSDRVHDTYFPYPWTEPKQCEKDRARGLRLIRENPEIEFVIFASFWSKVLDKLQATDEPTSIAHGHELMRQEMQLTIEEITALGRQVVLISDFPFFEVEGGPCAAATATRLWRNTRTICRTPVNSIPKENVWIQAKTTKVFEELARNNRGVLSLSLSDAFCKSGDCFTYLDGQFLYRDKWHLRRDLPAALNAKLASIMGLDDLLPKLGGNAAPLSSVPIDICRHPPATTVWRPTAPFPKRDGHSYYWNLPELTSISDDAAPTSPLVLCEDDRLLGPPHTALTEVSKSGLGRFLHAGPGVTLSTSDNSDPNTNGRSYSAFAFQAKTKGGS
jgi:SGNH domain (fused to AT3 domains)